MHCLWGAPDARRGVLPCLRRSTAGRACPVPALYRNRLLEGALHLPGPGVVGGSVVGLFAGATGLGLIAWGGSPVHVVVGIAVITGGLLCVVGAWGDWWRLFVSRRYLRSGRPLALVEGPPHWKSPETRARSSLPGYLQVGERRFAGNELDASALRALTTAPGRQAVTGEPLPVEVRAWYVPTTGVLAAAEVWPVVGQEMTPPGTPLQRRLRARLQQPGLAPTERAELEDLLRGVTAFAGEIARAPHVRGGHRRLLQHGRQLRERLERLLPEDPPPL
jgi:hypothetical protein